MQTLALNFGDISTFKNVHHSDLGDKQISLQLSEAPKSATVTSHLIKKSQSQSQSQSQSSTLQTLTHAELTAKIKSLATQERHLTEQILWHIAEVDRRRLFLRLAYSSLFDYLTREIGYTPGSAQRRIDAARLLQKLPEVADKIKSGDINLGQISKLQQAQRQLKKETGQTVNLEVQKSLLAKIEKQSLEETEQILAQHFDLRLEVAEKKRTQKDESVRIELTFLKSEMAMLRRAQEILSNKTGGGLKDTILAMAEKVVASREVKVQLSEPECQVKSGEINNRANLHEMTNKAMKNNSAATVAVNKTLTPKTKNVILSRDQSCQFKSPLTGQICGNKFHLEIDHIQPRYAKGSHAHDNLRVLCRQHNQFRYREHL